MRSSVWENAESFVLYSLEPGPPPADPKERVQGWPVLGGHFTTDATVRKRLVSALGKGWWIATEPSRAASTPACDPGDL